MSITTNVRESVMLFDSYLTHGSESLSFTAKKISFVETDETCKKSLSGVQEK